MDHEQYTIRSTPNQNLCVTPAGVCVRLGGANIWSAAVASRAHAGMSCTMWCRWLTATHQCTGFGASVLVGTVRARCDSWSVGLAGAQATFYLVRVDLSCGRFGRRFAGDGLAYPEN